MLRTGVRNPDAAGSEECSTSRQSEECANAYGGFAAMDVEQLYATLREYLQLEAKFQPKLILPAHSEHGEVSSGARDGAAHVMRCLKMWYDLPADVSIYATNLLDRFLTKMKVRPCHVPCISVSCMNIGIEAHAAAVGGRTVSIEELVSISQSACTVGDVARMSAVVRDKLSLSQPLAPVTPLHWLRLLAALAAWAATSLNAAAEYRSLVLERELVNQLEILTCDSACVNVRTCELALVLLFNHLECELAARQRRQQDAPDDLYRLFDFAVELQRICQIPDASLLQSHALVRSVLARYEARSKSEHRQRLVWRLSSRTLKVLKPTARLTSLLPTIEEQHLSPDAAPPRSRSGSESSDDDTKDWPRSPVLPVYCDN